MAHSLATKKMDRELAAIKEEDTSLFETSVFGLLSEINQYERLREEKVAASILEKRWNHVLLRARSLTTDWVHLKNLDYEMEEAKGLHMGDWH